MYGNNGGERGTERPLFARSIAVSRFWPHFRVQFMWSSYSTAPAVIPESALFYTTPISGSPFNISVVPGAAAYPYTEAYGEGVASASAGVFASFTIQTKVRTPEAVVIHVDQYVACYGVHKVAPNFKVDRSGHRRFAPLK